MVSRRHSGSGRFKPIEHLRLSDFYLPAGRLNAWRVAALSDGRRSTNTARTGFVCIPRRFATFSKRVPSPEPSSTSSEPAIDPRRDRARNRAWPMIELTV